MLNIIIVVIAIVALTAIVVFNEKHNISADGMGYIARYPNTGEHEVIRCNVQFVDKIKNMNIYTNKDLLSKLINEAAGQKIDEAFVGKDFDPEEFNCYAGGRIIDNAVSNNDPDIGAVIVNRVKLNNMLIKKIAREDANKLIDEAFLNMKAKAAASQAIDQAFYAANGAKKPVDLPLDFDLPILMEGEVYMKEVPEF